MLSPFKSLKRSIKRFVWALIGYIRQMFISFALNSKKSQTWIKIISNPFVKTSFLKIINPLRCVQFFFNRQKDEIINTDFKIPEIPYRGHAFFNIDNALKINPNIKRIGLIFFIGIGDYFYSTSFIELLKKNYPDLAFDAYVSKNTDAFNSPLTGNCIRVNPCFENVYNYDGYPGKSNWKNYDYSDCYKIAKDDTLLLPVIYEYNIYIKSRFDSLCKTFSLKNKKTNCKPVVYTDYPSSEIVKGLLEKIEIQMKKRKYKGIIFVQMTSRSSNYTYPYTKDLIKKHIDENYLIISPENIDLADESCIFIDIKKVNINETIKLLSILKDKNYKIFCNCIVSCFMAISSGLNIPMLVLQHYYDKGLKNIWFSNVYIIGNQDYPQIPKNHIFEATENDYRIDNNFFSYNPDFIAECFNLMLNNLNI